MALAINATVGASDANSCCTLAEAEAFHESRLHNAAWTAATEPTKIAALVWAARLLDTQILWEGIPTDCERQALQWPRIGMYGPASDTVYDAIGKPIADNEIPKQLKDAQAELAMYLITADTTAEVSSEGIGNLEVGTIKIGFNGQSVRRPIPNSVWEMISLWGSRMTGGATVKLVRS